MKISFATLILILTLGTSCHLQQNKTNKKTRAALSTEKTTDSDLASDHFEEENFVAQEGPCEKGAVIEANCFVDYGRGTRVVLLCQEGSWKSQLNNPCLVTQCDLGFPSNNRCPTPANAPMPGSGQKNPLPPDQNEAPRPIGEILPVPAPIQVLPPQMPVPGQVERPSPDPIDNQVSEEVEWPKEAPEVPIVETPIAAEEVAIETPPVIATPVDAKKEFDLLSFLAQPTPGSSLKISCYDYVKSFGLDLNENDFSVVKNSGESKKGYCLYVQVSKQADGKMKAICEEKFAKNNLGELANPNLVELFPVAKCPETDRVDHSAADGFTATRVHALDSELTLASVIRTSKPAPDFFESASLSLEDIKIEGRPNESCVQWINRLGVPAAGLQMQAQLISKVSHNEVLLSGGSFNKCFKAYASNKGKRYCDHGTIGNTPSARGQTDVSTINWDSFTHYALAFPVGKCEDDNYIYKNIIHYKQFIYDTPLIIRNFTGHEFDFSAAENELNVTGKEFLALDVLPAGRSSSSSIRISNLSASSTASVSVSVFDEWGEQKGQQKTYSIENKNTKIILSGQIQDEFGFIDNLEEGRYTLKIVSTAEISVMNLIRSPNGVLNNLGAVQKGLAETGEILLPNISLMDTPCIFGNGSCDLFSSDNSFIRIINSSNSTASGVSIEVFNAKGELISAKTGITITPMASYNIALDGDRNSLKITYGTFGQSPQTIDSAVSGSFNSKDISGRGYAIIKGAKGQIMATQKIASKSQNDPVKARDDGHRNITSGSEFAPKFKNKDGREMILLANISIDPNDGANSSIVATSFSPELESFSALIYGKSGKELGNFSFSIASTMSDIDKERFPNELPPSKIFTIRGHRKNDTDVAAGQSIVVSLESLMGRDFTDEEIENESPVRVALTSDKEYNHRVIFQHFKRDQLGNYTNHSCFKTFKNNLTSIDVIPQGDQLDQASVYGFNFSAAPLSFSYIFRTTTGQDIVGNTTLEFEAHQGQVKPFAEFSAIFPVINSNPTEFFIGRGMLMMKASQIEDRRSLGMMGLMKHLTYKTETNISCPLANK